MTIALVLSVGAGLSRMYAPFSAGLEIAAGSFDSLKVSYSGFGIFSSVFLSHLLDYNLHNLHKMCPAYMGLHVAFSIL